MKPRRKLGRLVSACFIFLLWTNALQSLGRSMILYGKLDSWFDSEKTQKILFFTYRMTFFALNTIADALIFMTIVAIKKE